MGPVQDLPESPNAKQCYINPNPPRRPASLPICPALPKSLFAFLAVAGHCTSLNEYTDSSMNRK